MASCMPKWFEVLWTFDNVRTKRRWISKTFFTPRPLIYNKHMIWICYCFPGLLERVDDQFLIWIPSGDVERAGSNRSASSDVLNFKFSHPLSRATPWIFVPSSEILAWIPPNLFLCHLSHAELQCYQVFWFKNWNIDLPFIRTVQQTYIECVREEFQKVLAIKGQHIYHFHHATSTIFLR